MVYRLISIIIIVKIFKFKMYWRHHIMKDLNIRPDSSFFKHNNRNIFIKTKKSENKKNIFKKILLEEINKIKD